MNLEGKISLIKSAVQSIKQAIIGKGQTPSGNLTTYATAIDNIVKSNTTPLTVTPSTSSQTISPVSPYTGFGTVTVNAVTSSIDPNITANNIKKGTSILGVNGNCEELVGQSKTITSNGTYYPDENYNGLTSVIVNAPSGIIRETVNGVYQIPSSNFTFNLPNNATNIGNYALQNAFSSCLTLIGVNFNNITTIGGNNALTRAFENCSNLTSIDLSNLTTVSGYYAMSYAFYNCIGLTSIDLSNLTTVSGNNAFQYTFRGCTNLVAVDLENLTNITADYGLSYMFYGCNNLTNITFNNLSNLSLSNNTLYGTFTNCTKLQTLSFPSLTSNSFGLRDNQFRGMLSGVKGCTVHFPSNLQSVIGSWSDVQSGFNGTNTTVLFDLPATT